MIYAPYEEYRIYLLLNLIASWHFLSEDVSQKIVFPHDQFRATHSTNDDIPS